jgi:MFS family permease
MMFYMLRFLLGVAEAGFFPGMILYLTYWFPKKQIGSATARFMMAVPVAGVVGGLVASMVPTLNGVLGLPGWKWLFLTTGALPVFLGILTFVHLPEKPLQARWLTEQERAWLLARLAEELDDQPPSQRNSVATLVLNKRVWLLASLYFTLTVGMYGYQLWLPQIIHAVATSDERTTALLTLVPTVFQALGMLIVANHSDKTGERRLHIVGSAALAACMLALSCCASDGRLAFAALSLAAFGIWGTVGPFWALSTGYLSREAAAAGIGLINCVGNLGGFAGPYIVGLAKQQFSSFQYALMSVAVFLLVGAMLAFTINRND